MEPDYDKQDLVNKVVVDSVDGVEDVEILIEDALLDLVNYFLENNKNNKVGMVAFLPVVNKIDLKEDVFENTENLNYFIDMKNIGTSSFDCNPIDKNINERVVILVGDAYVYYWVKVRKQVRTMEMDPEVVI